MFRHQTRLITRGMAVLVCGAAIAVAGAGTAVAGNRTAIFMPVRAASHHHGSGTLLSYHGGVGGIGVETSPRVYLVVWGSQWNGHDPSGEVGILQRFISGTMGSSWLNSVIQYCQNVAVGTTNCSGVAGAVFASNGGTFAGTWTDTGSAAPSHPTQSQLAAEAVKAAGQLGNTTAASNATTQYVIATATGNSSSGFGTQYCAYHSSTSSTVGTVAYTNLPYIMDAGGSCGANFVNSGTGGLTDGVTIVEGHELAETVTDQFPNGGWLDGRGAENGDKCAWISSGQGASQNVQFGGSSYAVQSLWSNAFSGGAGGCVISYP